MISAFFRKRKIKKIRELARKLQKDEGLPEGPAIRRAVKELKYA
jgi:hypothetical protein